MKVIYLVAVLLTAFLFTEAPPALEPRPELVVQTGHSELISAIAFSADSQLVASGSWDNTLKIWDAATGVQIRALNGHSNRVTSVAFSPDGKLLASGSMDYTAKVWDAMTGQVLHTLTKHSMPVQSVAIGRDGSMLATAGIDKLIILWDLNTGKEIRILSGHEGNVSSVAFSPDGARLASSSWDHTVRVWNTTTGAVIHKLEAPGALMSVAFSADGRTIASAGFRSVIKAWDAASGQELYTQVAGAEWIFPLAFSPDSKMLVTGSNSLDDHTVKAWDARSGKELPAFAAYKHPRIFSLAFSPDGRTLALGGDRHTITLLDTTTASARLTLEGHSVAVNSVALSPDGQTLAVSGQGPVIKLWDLQAQAPPRNLTGHEYFVNAVAFSPDGRLLASGSADKTVRLWDLLTGTSKPLTGHAAIVNCVAFSQDSKLLASGGDDNTIKLWNADTGALVSTLNGHIDSVRMIAFAPDGKTLASASGDTLIKIWDVAGAKELRTLEGHSNWVQAVAFSSDGKTLASGSVDTTIKIWDLNNEREPRTLSGHSSVVQSVSFSPDGKTLVSGSWDRTVRIWEVASGRQTQTLAGHSDRVVSVAFHRDGRTIASGSKDGQARLWHAPNAKALASLTALDENDWAVVAPDGRFEASRDGMKLMHFVKANQAIPLDSFFEKFYRVRLLARVLSEEGARPPARPVIGPKTKPPRPGPESSIDIAKQISPPPLVRIVSPSAAQSVDNDTFQITVEAIDQGAGIDGIRLYQNEKVVAGEERRLVHTPSNRKTFEVILVPGTNVFRAVAFNRNRVGSSAPAEIKIELRKPEATGDLYILAIGLNEYKNSNYNLNYGVADAQAFADAVEQRASGIFKRIHKKVILSPDATSSSTFANRSLIETAFNKVISEAKRPDAFVFYYAGHGVMSMGDDRKAPQFYIVPYDVTQLYGNDSGLAAKGISAETLKELSMRVAAQKQLLILDACYSGGAIEAFKGRGSPEQEDAMAQLARSTGVLLLAATSAQQIATEFDSLGHGLFTYALLQGLSGEAARSSSGAGKITVLQLVAYLNDKVPELTKKYRGRAQYPNAFVSGQDFPLGVR